MHFRKIKRQLTEVYINEPLETDSEGNTLTIADILSSGVNIEEETELRINSQKLYRFIAEELDDREREIICRRYGIRNGRGYVGKTLTQREIAKEFGISRSYIRGLRKGLWRSSGGGLRRDRGRNGSCPAQGTDRITYL